MIKYASENFISYHLNVDSTQNKELARRYNIRSIPAFVFVDEEGNEIDRIVGFMPPSEYQAEMTRIRNGINTIPDLTKRLQDEPDNLDLLTNLAMKMEKMGGLKAAISYWEELFTKENASPTQLSTAGLKLAVYHAQENDDAETLVSFINSETNTEILPQAYDALRGFYRQAKDTEAEADTYRRYVDFMTGTNQESASLYNGYAWRMSQLEINLPNALERIDQAIALLTDEDGDRETAQIKDTKAEVLWKMGRVDDAVAVIKACIAIQPEDKYYKEQLAKFQADLPE